MKLEDIKLGTLVDHPSGIAKIVAFKKGDRENSVLVRFIDKENRPNFTHSGLATYPYENLNQYEYIDLDKMKGSSYWIRPKFYDVFKQVTDIEDD